MTVVEVTQNVAHEVIAMATKSFVRTQIKEHTDVEPNAIRVWVASYVAGELVANASDKVTKPIIEKAVVKVKTWRNRKDQKEETSEGSAA